MTDGQGSDPAHRGGRAWAPWTTWGTAAAAGIAAILLFVLAYIGPHAPVTETGDSGTAVFVARLAVAVFMLVLTVSCLIQGALYLPQRSASRPGVTAPAVLDLLVLVGVVVETVLALSVGPDDQRYLTLAILAGGVGIALLAVLRFAVLAASGIGELVARRQERRSI